MRFVTYETGTVQNAGVLSENGRVIIPVNKALNRPAPMSMVEFIQTRTEADMERLQALAKEPKSDKALTGDLIPAYEAKITAPITRPIHDILCVGLNYLSHIAEQKKGLQQSAVKPLDHSVYFSKRAIRIIGSGEPVMGRTDIDPEMDYEVELAVIIGKTCRDVSREEAESCIFGYSVFNDFSSRIIQRRHRQWMKGKSLDTYSAMGPAIVTKDEIPWPVELAVSCTVNGEVRQSSNTSLFLNDIAGVISDLSQGMTLEAGDIIATGTPSGVAMGMDEPKYLKKGDEVVCEIEKIGKLINRVE